MAPQQTRRPLPALIALLVLSLLTTIVWWRVIHRANDTAASSTPCTPSPTATAAPVSSGQPAGVTLAVRNSTDRVGLARKTADELQRHGFVVSKVDNISPRINGVATIKYAKEDERSAKALAELMPGSSLSAKGVKGVVEIDLGTKFTAVKITTTPTPTPAC